jgi:hypothetical protein
MQFHPLFGTKLLHKLRSVCTFFIYMKRQAYGIMANCLFPQVTLEPNDGFS